MALTVFYFAALRDALGTREESLALPSGELTVSELLGHLEQIHPELSGRLGAVRVAVNECFAEAGELVRAGDVVALIPPVAGG
jgi:molybdopterin converting factor subunit 1